MKTHFFFSIFFGRTVSIALIGLLTMSHLMAQEAYIATRTLATGVQVGLTWTPVPSAYGYLIYRKTTAVGDYPATGLTASPIRPVSNCAIISSILLNPDSTAWHIVSKGLSAGTTLFNPCLLATITPASAQYNRLKLLAQGNLAISRVAGIGWIDASVVTGTTYFYRIVAVNSSLQAIATVATDLSSTAGIPALLPPPAGVEADAGDASVLVLWERIQKAAGYDIQRATVPFGLFVSIHDNLGSAKFTKHLNGDTLLPDKQGFLDFQRWTSTGAPGTHTVKGITLSGPQNGVTYRYRVRSVDLFGQAGSASAVVTATPADKTAPATVSGLTATPDDVSGQVALRWNQSISDINGHRELNGIKQYELYRFNQSEDPNGADRQLAKTIFGPFTPGLLTFESTDNWSGLRTAFGDQTWWYRLVAVDQANNRSGWSVAALAIVKDITAPGLVQDLKTAGQEDRIELTWKPNPEPDMATYEVYRSYCHYGQWIPCDKRAKEAAMYSATGQRKDTTCSGPFVFLGELSADSLRKAIAASHPAFIDRSLPAGSPLCYAYWIKARDKSGNKSGDWPYPFSAAEQATIRCDRLRDKTAPEPALIAGLLAKDGAIDIKWIGPPTQDIHAYHVYRAEGTTGQTEPVPSLFKWVGGTTVEVPPTLPISLSAPYHPTTPAGCAVIPVSSNEYMSAGQLLDAGIQPHQVYWYKVVGIDYDGNEGKLTTAVPVSTFSFSTGHLPAPTITTISVNATPCSLVIEWSPIFDSLQHIGAAVYRSDSPWGAFQRINELIKATGYIDEQVVKGRTYWYRVALLSTDGTLSALSLPLSGTVPN